MQLSSARLSITLLSASSSLLSLFLTRPLPLLAAYPCLSASRGAEAVDRLLSLSLLFFLWMDEGKKDWILWLSSFSRSGLVTGAWAQHQRGLFTQRLKMSGGVIIDQLHEVSTFPLRAHTGGDDRLLTCNHLLDKGGGASYVTLQSKAN